MKEFTIGLIFNNVIFGIAFLLVLAMSPLLKKYSKRWRYIVFIVIGVSLMIPFTMLSKAAVSQMPEIKKEKVVQGKKQIVMGKDSTWKYVREKQEKQKTERSLEEEQAPERQEVDAKEPGKTESSGKKMKNEKKESGVVQWLKQWYQGTDKDVILKGIFWVWIIVAVVNMMYYLFLYQYHKKRIRRFRTPVSDEELRELFLKEKETLNIDREIGLFQCQRINTPMAVGVVHTSILIPYMEHYQGVRYILMHELVHQKKRDMWVKLFYVIVKCVHWFNPFVHLMVKIAYDDIELLCDDEVVKTLEKKERIEYNESILNVVKEQYRYEEKEKIAFSFGMIQGENDLKVRMLNIMNMNKKPRGVKCAVMLCAVILIIGCGTAFHQSYVSQAKENLQGIQLHSKSVYRAMASIERKKRKQYDQFVEKKSEEVLENSELWNPFFSAIKETACADIDYKEQKELFFWTTVKHWGELCYCDFFGCKEGEGVPIVKNTYTAVDGLPESGYGYYELREQDVEKLCESLYGEIMEPETIPEELGIVYDRKKQAYYFTSDGELSVQEESLIYDHNVFYSVLTKSWSANIANLGEGKDFTVHCFVRFEDADNYYRCRITEVKKEKDEWSEEDTDIPGTNNTEEETENNKEIEIVRNPDDENLLEQKKVQQMMENILIEQKVSPVVMALIDSGSPSFEGAKKKASGEAFQNAVIADMFLRVQEDRFAHNDYSGQGLYEDAGEEKDLVEPSFVENMGAVLLGKKITPETLPKGQWVSYDEQKGKYSVRWFATEVVDYTVQNVEVTKDGILLEGEDISYRDYIGLETDKEYSLWLKYDEDNQYHFSFDKIKVF
ncbi:MAG: M56 family metallopeptidase [Eubacterium sp.]|nr:M56 family metallopeptidase [Eubacterium sp.]